VAALLRSWLVVFATGSRIGVRDEQLRRARYFSVTRPFFMDAPEFVSEDFTKRTTRTARGEAD
jgi:hypothetical protein